MKDHRLNTSFENYEAFDVIAGSNYGDWCFCYKDSEAQQ